MDELVRSLAVSAARMTAILVMTPTALAMGGTAIVAISVSRPDTRGDINHPPAWRRSANYARWAIRHHRRAINDRRQTTGSGHHDGRCEDDRRREGDANRPTRLRRGGEPGNGNHCYQTEEMFCLHERFDGVFSGFFNGRKKWNMVECELVSDQRGENE